jgi:endonuclease/exonuclease/phosphatase family metal-dependent hydrolase
MPHLSLLALNTFGLPFYLARSRLVRLIRELHRHPKSVLCLQEVQQNHYLRLLLRGLNAYPHFVYRPGRLAPKGGLLTASQWPLEHSYFSAYRQLGRWLGPAAGDRFLEKGLLAAHLRVHGLPVTVLNTHLNANYSGDWSPANPFARILRAQVRQLAQWVQAQPHDSLVIVCGDFNFPRGSFLYHELLAESGLTDPLADDPRPTYRPFGLIPARYALAIDFVLYRAPAGLELNLSADVFPLEDSAHSHTRRRSLSDHNALTLSLSWPAAVARHGGLASTHPSFSAQDF